MGRDSGIQAFYESEIEPVLPPVILDFHTHIWSSDNWREKPCESGAKGGKYMVVECEYPSGALLRDGRKCFPGRDYEAVIFGYPTPAVDWQKDTRYVAEAAKRPGLYPLMLAGRPLGRAPAEMEVSLREGRFLGYKVFLNWVGNDYGEITVEDMLGPAEMTLANRLGLVVLLHVPRGGRLADPVVQAGVERLAKEYPHAHIVLAHAGRCYLPTEMKKALGVLKDLSNVYMDTSMVMDPIVLQMAMEGVGSQRLLYGSDFPVAAMKGRRIRIMDHWVDVVLPGYPESAYRVAAPGIRATYMAVEIVIAIRDAAERVGLDDQELAGIFYENGMRILKEVDGGRPFARLKNAWKGERHVARDNTT